MLDRIRSYLQSAWGWSFVATRPVSDRGAAAPGETIVVSSILTNTGARLGTAYVRFFIADSYSRADPLFDSHRDLSPNARQSLRVVDIAPRSVRTVSCSWTIPPNTANRHLDLKIQVWNPHLLFGGPYKHKFFDTNWVGGLEVIDLPKSRHSRVFISYSHDDDSHIQWVRKLADELRRYDFDVILDFTHLRPGQDISHFIETAVQTSGVRLLVCSTAYTQKADARLAGGVGFETVISSKEYYAAAPEQKLRFIPLIRSNRLPANRRLPAYLGNAFYIDMSDDDWRAEPMQQLVTAINRLDLTSPL